VIDSLSNETGAGYTIHVKAQKNIFNLTQYTEETNSSKNTGPNLNDPALFLSGDPKSTVTTTVSRDEAMITG